jgi:hypothetical protein
MRGDTGNAGAQNLEHRLDRLEVAVLTARDSEGEALAAGKRF